MNWLPAAFVLCAGVSFTLGMMFGARVVLRRLQ